MLSHSDYCLINSHTLVPSLKKNNHASVRLHAHAKHLTVHIPRKAAQTEVYLACRRGPWFNPQVPNTKIKQCLEQNVQYSLYVYIFILFYF